MGEMSARRRVPKASALPTGPETAKKADSRLDHVLLVGMGNMSIKASTAVPITNKKLSFAVAQNKPGVKVDLFDKKPSVVHAADIGVPMKNLESTNDVEMEISDLTFELQNRMAVGFLGNYPRAGVYGLWVLILQIGNIGQLAGPDKGKSIREFYLYLVKLFGKALVSMDRQGKGDEAFAKSWKDGLKQEEVLARDLLAKIVRDTALSKENPDNMKFQEAALLYYDYVNKQIFQFFSKDTTPKLTKWFNDRDVEDAAHILRTLRYQPSDSPPGSPESES